MPRFGAGQGGQRAGERDALHQHILVQRGQGHALGLRKPLGDALDLGALAVVLVAVDEGGQEAHDHDGLDLGSGHVAFRRGPVRASAGLKVSLPGGGVTSRLAACYQRAVTFLSFGCGGEFGSPVSCSALAFERAALPARAAPRV